MRIKNRWWVFWVFRTHAFLNSVFFILNRQSIIWKHKCNVINKIQNNIRLILFNEQLINILSKCPGAFDNNFLCLWKTLLITLLIKVRFTLSKTIVFFPVAQFLDPIVVWRHVLRSQHNYLAHNAVSSCTNHQLCYVVRLPSGCAPLHNTCVMQPLNVLCLGMCVMLLLSYVIFLKCSQDKLDQTNTIFNCWFNCISLCTPKVSSSLLNPRSQCLTPQSF